MAEHLVFSAQHPPEKMVEGPGGGANPEFHCKRARSDCDDLSAMPQRERVDSFKTKLLGVSNPSNWKGFGDGKEKITIEDSDFVLVEGSNGQDVILSEELKSKLCKPWANVLILKIMGRSHSLNFMIQKLTQKWSLVGQWQLTDLEDGYFVARFQFVADLEYVLTEGPWMVTNQYLVVQRWRPNFVPGEEPIRVMPVWLRLSGLPMEWVDAGFLWKLGGILGKTCRVDQITEAQSRGRYARLCIEIDISKPLRSYMKVDGKIIRIEYENLSMVCFICGKVGHVQGNCKEGDMDQGTPIEKVVKNAELVDSATPYGPSRPPVEEMSGTSKATETGIKQRPIVSKPISSKPVGGKGSRFDVLSEQMVEESDAIMEGKVLKGKDLLTTSGEPDTPLAVGKTVLRDIPNRGKTPRRDQMALKAGTSKIKKVPFPKKGLLNFRSPPILLQKEVVLNPNPVDDMEDVCEDSEVLQSLHKDVLNSDMTDKEKMRATSGDPQNLIGELFPSIIDLNADVEFVEVVSNLKEAMNSPSVSLEVVASSRYTITFVATESKKCWVTTVVYANPSCGIRKNLWQYLNLIRGCFVGPWVVLGDFNEITHLAEKKGGRACFSDTGFRDWINVNCLVDLGFVGQKFTWMTKRGVNDDIWCRLNRAVCSIDWRMMFPEGFVRHLPRINSDHCPIVLNLYSAHIPTILLNRFVLKLCGLRMLNIVGFFDYTSLPALFPTIDDISRENMCRGISEEEVKSSLFDIGGLKTPGPDGFPAVFFQNQWPLCKVDLVNMVTNSFRLGHFPFELNQTLIGSWKPIAVSRGGPLISHLFFADDLILFGHATIQQAESMKLCLDRFCSSSGQEVSLSKSRVFCSSLVRDGDARALASICGSPITKDLGKYFGVPLLHSRITKHTYCEILEKTQKRLAS
ncbi:hypothetical protein ACOSQ2_019787 [Xanthoceras sorbifolium]